mgnify:FL=1
MKKLIFLFLAFGLILLSGYPVFSQNEKCISFSKNVIQNAKAKIQREGIDSNDNYCIKAEFSATLELEALKNICDTTLKAKSVSFNWRMNYDKNPEKEYKINGSNLLVTIYFNDKFLFFEFPVDKKLK